MDISIIVPTSTGAANIPELVTRIGAAETRFETTSSVLMTRRMTPHGRSLGQSLRSTPARMCTRSTGRSPLVNYPVRSLRGFGKVRRMGSS